MGEGQYKTEFESRLSYLKTNSLNIKGNFSSCVRKSHFKMMLLFTAHVNVTDIFCSVMGEELSTHYIATHESGYSPGRTFIHGKQSVLVYFLSGQIEQPLKIELFQTRNNALKNSFTFQAHAMITVKFTVAFLKTIHTCITQKFTSI